MKLIVTKVGLLAFSVVMFQPVVAQTAVPSNQGEVEITRSKLSDIPAQYRADSPKPRKPFAVRYTCPESGRLYVVFDNAQHTATVEAGNTTRYLRQVVSADGGRYANSDESYVFWVKGNRASINARETCEAD